MGPTVRLTALASFLSLIAPTTRALLAEDLTLKAPVELTREQDRERLMGLLGIKTLRLGPTSRNEPQPGRFGLVNYDEAKANPFPNLPPLLLTNARDEVTTPWLWWNVRRPEIVELFDREIYGRVPQQMPEVQWKVIESKEETHNRVAVTTPADACGPVPVILRFTRRPPAGQPERPRPAIDAPSVESQILARGWGYAALDPNSIQEDNGGSMTRGIIGLLNKGQPRDVDDWGALRAWAWCASRAVDFFETDEAVDAKRVGIQGNSRYGKAALVAMAYDQRPAAAYVNSSGEGGASLYRRNWGEVIENVAATTEYHWTAGNFLKYAGLLSWDDLPIDTHQLIALCAPRPVFISVEATSATSGSTLRACSWPPPQPSRSGAYLGRRAWGQKNSQDWKWASWTVRSPFGNMPRATWIARIGLSSWVSRRDIFSLGHYWKLEEGAWEAG